MSVNGTAAAVEPARCVLHTAHSPVNLTVEHHHVIPVAWQLFWQPANPPFPGPDPSGRGMLWDNRTIVCCPTGHRNVHYDIVKMMHVVSSENPQDAITAAHVRASLTSGWAGQALRRFAGAGGSLQALVAAREWGVA